MDEPLILEVGKRYKIQLREMGDVWTIGNITDGKYCYLWDGGHDCYL